MEGLDGAVIDSAVETGATDTGTEQVIDQTTQDTAEVATGTEQAENQEVEQEEVGGDGRTLPKEVQAALKALKDLNPGNIKAVNTLRQAYFAEQHYLKAFPTPAAAHSAKAALELVGGSEGIAGLQSQIAAGEQMDASLEQGDPAVLDDVIKDFPEGFKKLAPHVLDRLQTLDPTAYAKTVQPHAYGLLEAAGLGQVISSMQQALEGNNVAQVKELLGKTQAWLDGQKQKAGERQNQPDPERAKFDTERQKFQQEKEQAFRGDIGRQTVTHQNEVMTKSLSPYLKGKNLSSEAKTDLADGINREIAKLLKSNTAYQSQVKAMLGARTRDQGKIVSYINAAVDEATPKAVKSVWDRRYGAVPVTKAAPKPGTLGAKPTSGGVVKLPTKPNRADVDWEKDPSRMLFITNKAFMKTGPYKGRQVTW